MTQHFSRNFVSFMRRDYSKIEEVGSSLVGSKDQS